MLTAGNVILVLKIAVVAVTILLLISLVALALRRYRLHGRINIAFFVLTLSALIGLEVIARVIQPDLFREHFDRTNAWTALYVHLCFSLPSALLLPAMLVTGLRHRWRTHVALGVLFLIFWAGTFVTGVFFLPHSAP